MEREIQLGKYKIEASRWPWQGYGWFPHKDSSNRIAAAPLNANGARFGGGWRYELGVRIGGSTIILSLVFGMIRISKD